jgi:predicted nucleic acid-binding protein
VAGVSHVLDASAIIACLRQEPGHERLASLIADPANALVVHAINLGEVYYTALRDQDEDAARTAVRLSREFARERRHLGREFMAHGASWKVRFRVPYGDAFALAVAEREDAPLVTGDHNDFEPIEKAGAIKVFWLR